MGSAARHSPRTSIRRTFLAQRNGAIRDAALPITRTSLELAPIARPSFRG